MVDRPRQPLINHHCRSGGDAVTFIFQPQESQMRSGPATRSEGRSGRYCTSVRDALKARAGWVRRTCASVAVLACGSSSCRVPNGSANGVMDSQVSVAFDAIEEPSASFAGQRIELVRAGVEVEITEARRISQPALGKPRPMSPPPMQGVVTTGDGTTKWRHTKCWNKNRWEYWDEENQAKKYWDGKKWKWVN